MSTSSAPSKENAWRYGANASLVDALHAAAIPAALTIAAMIAAFCTTYALSIPFHAGANAAILSAVLTLTQGRKQKGAHHAPLQKLMMFPIVALGICAIGALLHFVFVVGAIVYVAAMAFSIWSRQLEGKWRRIGSLVALPLVAVLVVPALPNAPGGRAINLVLVIAAGLIAHAWLIAANRLALRAGVAAKPQAASMRAATVARKPGAIDPNTRMAVQMAVALSAAFLIGGLAFAHHWSWVVLTAFIVCSGSVSRGDAVYKGILRLGGALAGTLVAALVQYVVAPHGVEAAVLIFGALFIGLWLRDVNYAWWAACVTLVIATLQATENSATTSFLQLRLEEILIGALCGVAATWFVMPIRTDALIRRRLSDALLALDEWMISTEAPDDDRTHKQIVFNECIARFDSVAPPVEWHRRLTPWNKNDNHPAVWVHLMRRCAHHTHAFVGSRQDLVRAVRQTRKTLAQHELSTTDALRRIHALLENDKAS